MVADLVSVGGARLTLPALRLAEAVEGLPLIPAVDTRRGWDGSAERRLRATENTQGQAAADATVDRMWIHLEHSVTVRGDPERWEPILTQVLGARLREYLPVDVPVGPDAVIRVDADSGPDHFRMTLSGHRTLGVPVGGRWGRRILVQVGAAGGPLSLTIYPVLQGGQPGVVI
jgi:hypothetical protein